MDLCYNVELYVFRSIQCSLWEAFILKVSCFLPTISIVELELWATVLSVQDSVGTNSNFETNTNSIHSQIKTNINSIQIVDTIQISTLILQNISK